MRHIEDFLMSEFPLLVPHLIPHRNLLFLLSATVIVVLNSSWLTALVAHTHTHTHTTSLNICPLNKTVRAECAGGNPNVFHPSCFV